MCARVLYDAFVSDPLHVDIQPAVFHSWLRGLTAAELIADLPGQLHRHFHFHVHQSAAAATTPQPRRLAPRRRRHRQRPSVSSSSSASSSPSSPSSLPPRVLSSPPTGSPNISRRPSAADERLEAAGTPHTIIHQLAALHIPSTATAAATATATANATNAAAAAEDSPRSKSPSSDDGDDSSGDDEVQQAAAALSSAAYGRLLAAAQHAIHSQYRVFGLLSHYFHSPHLLASPCPPLQLPAASLSALLSAYYSFHPPLLRELCGAKLKALTRSDVDVIGMRVGVRPVSAWRMLENVRRMYRVRWPDRDDEREEEPAGGLVGTASGNLSRNASLRWRQMRSAVGKMRASGGKAGAGGDDADELDDSGGGASGLSTASLLSELFYLPVPLARSYTQLAFLCRHRIQSDSKRLTGVGWEDMMLIAHWLMERWTVRVADEDGAGRLNRHSSAPTLHKQSNASRSGRGDEGSITSITPLPSPALTAGTFTQTVSSSANPLSSPYPSTAPNFPYGVLLSTLTLAPPLLAGTAPLPASPSLSVASSAAALGGVDELGDSLDMEFVAELRSVKVHIGDNRRLMDEYITAILSAVRDYSSPAPASSPSPPTTPTAASAASASASSRSLLYDKLKGRGVAVYVRALLGLAVPLGKPKRHRQLLVALADDVVRLGLKGGLTSAEMAVLLDCVSRGWEAVGDVRLKVNVMRERQREGLTAAVASSAGGVTAYNDEVARCYLNWMRFLSAVVPITALLYRRMRPLNEA